jgi:ankyrin repeat protein
MKLLGAKIMRKSILRMVRLCLMVCSLFFFVGCKEKPIHHAAYDRDLEKVKKIIEKDPNQINVQDASGYSPLHLASGGGHTEIVKFLLNHGADIESEIFYGDTPLMLAAWHAGDGKYETIKVLLEHGAKVNHKDKSDCTALHYASMHSGKEVINLLISYGADVNAKDKNLTTPLIQAAMLRNIEAAKALVENGADIFAKRHSSTQELLNTYPPSNITAKDIALLRGDKEMAQYLQTKEEEKEKEKEKSVGN